MITFGAFCSLMVSVINGLFAWVVKTVVDDVFVRGDKALLLAVSLGIIGAFVMRGMFAFFQNYVMFSVGARIVRDIRDHLYRHMVYLPISYFGSDTRGSLMTKVISDAEILKELLAFRVKDFFVSSGTIIILTGVALYRRWDLTLLALGVLPFAFHIVGKLGKRLKKVSRWAQAKLGHITESLSEGITGLKVIKAFGVEEQVSGKFATKTQEYYSEFMKSIKYIQLTSLLMELVAGLGVALIIYYGGQLIAGGEMTSGDFFSFMAAILMIFTPAKRLAQVHNGFQQAKAYLSRIDDVLESPREEEGSLENVGFLRDIVYDNIHFQYAGREGKALDGVSVTLEKGSVVALVGRSGSGKTTFVDLLARFYDPQDGRILIDGIDIREMKSHALRSMIGLVSQNIVLFNDSVRANIAFSRPEARDGEIKMAAEAAFADEFIRGLPDGYDTVIGEEGATLSGGQRQRISIARALLADAPILVLDEATSSLDTQSEMMVQKALDNLMDNDGPEGP
jgi:subfamily B ATP-binding cassette protein MsbA